MCNARQNWIIATNYIFPFSKETKKRGELKFTRSISIQNGHVSNHTMSICIALCDYKNDAKICKSLLDICAVGVSARSHDFLTRMRCASETQRPKRWMVQMIMNYGLIKSTLKLSLSKAFMSDEQKLPWPYRTTEHRTIFSRWALVLKLRRDAFTIYIHWMLCLYGVTYAKRHT